MANAAEDRDQAFALARKSLDAYARHGCDSCIGSSINLRANLILRFGEGGVADPGEIVDAVRACVTASPEETLARAKAWKESLDLKTACELRRLKNRLATLARIEEERPDLVPEDLRAYTAIRRELP